MRAKILHHAAAMLPLVYAPLAAGPAVEARAEPPAHRKEAATAEDGAHEAEGEGAPPEGPDFGQPVSTPTGISARLAAFLAAEDPPHRAQTNPRAVDPEWALAPIVVSKV
jgi:hypothetical protein